MSTAAHYREEAKRYRERAAAAAPDSEAARQWLRFAADNDRVADLLESDGETQSPAQEGLTQQQIKQQPEDRE